MIGIAIGCIFVVIAWRFISNKEETEKVTAREFFQFFVTCMLAVSAAVAVVMIGAAMISNVENKTVYFISIMLFMVIGIILAILIIFKMTPIAIQKLLGIR